MEEKTDVEFFKILAKQNVQLRILETGFLNGSVVLSVIYTDDSGYIKYKFPKSMQLNTYLQKVVEENEIKSKVLGITNPKLLHFSKFGKKRAYTESELKDILSKKRFPINSNVVQRLNICSFIDEVSITAKLLYINKNFKIGLSVDNVTTTDPLTTSAVLDMLTLIISALETYELKRVVYLEVEFLKDSFHSLWLSSCKKCYLIEARFLVNKNILSEEDLLAFCKTFAKNSSQKLLLSKPSSRRSVVITDYIDFSEFYLFKRGQLRNISSNLNSPIRFITPNIEDYDEASPLNKSPAFGEDRNSHDLLSKNIRNSEPDYARFQSLLNKNLLNSPELQKETELSRSFSKDELRASAKKKMTEMPKKIFSFERIRKNTHAKTPTSLKAVPKKKPQGYGNYFVELVLNTYLKKNFDAKNKLGEFGMGSMVTNEEFSNFLNSFDAKNEESLKPQRNTKSVIDEIYSKCASPLDVMDLKIPTKTKKKSRAIKKTSEMIVKKQKTGLLPIVSPKKVLSTPKIVIIK